MEFKCHNWSVRPPAVSSNTGGSISDAICVQDLQDHVSEVDCLLHHAKPVVCLFRSRVNHGSLY